MPLYSVRPEAMSRYATWTAGIGSMDREHLLKLGIDTQDVLATEVPCRSLMSLVAEHGFEQLDYLQVDTEGFDDEILQQIDFNVLLPQMIKFEVLHLKPARKSHLLQLLRKAGYRLLDDRRDMIAVR